MTTQAPYALLVDAETGAVLLEKEADQKIMPSSMTKIALCYILFEALKNGDIKLTDRVFVSKNASAQPGSRMFLKAGQQVSYEDLLRGILAISGNDACTAVGESLAGTESQCAQMINERMKELGAANTHFTNTSGLPDKEHWSTCRDLMAMALATLRHFPQEYKKYYGMRSFSFNGINQYNRNELLRLGMADGMKTGWTQEAKHGIVASCEKEGRRLVLVINGLDKNEERTEESQRLLNWGLQFFDSIHLFKEGQSVVKAPVWGQNSVDLITPVPISFTYPKRLYKKLKVIVRYYAPLRCPVQKGKKIGMLTVSLPNYPSLEYPLVAAHDVKNHGLWSWISGLFSVKK